MMEALCSSKMSITIYQSTSCHTWQNLDLQTHLYQNLKSCNKTTSLFRFSVMVLCSLVGRGTLYLLQCQSDRWGCVQAIQITCQGLWLHWIKGEEGEDAESNDEQWIMRNCPLFVATAEMKVRTQNFLEPNRGRRESLSCLQREFLLSLQGMDYRLLPSW